MERCKKCGTTENLNRHHIIYRSNHGSNDKANIEIYCRDCHIELHKQDFRYWGLMGWESLCINLTRNIAKGSESSVISQYMSKIGHNGAKKRWQNNKKRLKQ